MRYRREDVVSRALDVLDTWGLADLSMRRLGAELGVQPSAIYHHFATKQELLAAVADELLRRGLRASGSSRSASWQVRLREAALMLRDALLAWRDGAELVATAYAFSLGGRAAADHLSSAMSDSRLPDDVVDVATTTLLYYVFGRVVDEQTELQAGSAGVIDAAPRDVTGFLDGLALIIDGIAARAHSGAHSGSVSV